MKATLLTGIFFLISCIAFGQSKKEIMLEISTFQKKTFINASHDVPKQKIWDAIYVMMKQEYPDIKKQDFDKGIIEGYSEADNFKEAFTTELVGSGPYRVTFSMKRQVRYKDGNGAYTGWYDKNEIPYDYLYKIQKTIYEEVNGKIELPAELQDKIEEYNAKQKKYKNKILMGKDY